MHEIERNGIGLIESYTGTSDVSESNDKQDVNIQGMQGIKHRCDKKAIKDLNYKVEQIKWICVVIVGPNWRVVYSARASNDLMSLYGD